MQSRITSNDTYTGITMLKIFHQHLDPDKDQDHGDALL